MPIVYEFEGLICNWNLLLAKMFFFSSLVRKIPKIRFQMFIRSTKHSFSGCLILELIPVVISITVSSD